MELTKKRHELIRISNDLDALDMSGVKICYAIARSNDKIKAEVKAIKAAQKPLAEYHKQQSELAQKHAALDTDGNPKRTPGGFIIADLSGYNTELAALDKKYRKELDELEAFMEEEVTVKVHALSEDDLPEDINMTKMKALLPLINQKE